MSTKRQASLYFLLLGILVGSIYIQTLTFDYTLDDRGLVIDRISGKIDDFKSLKQLITSRYNNRDYRPVTLLSFGIENWIIGELNSKVSHGVNLALFYLVLIALFFLFKKIIPTTSPNNHTLFGILIFTCHPLCVEVVASVKSRDGLLSMLFTILALILLIVEWKKSNTIKIILGFILLLFASLAKLDALGVFLFIPCYFLIKNGINKSNLVYIFCFIYISFILSRLLFISIETVADPIDIDTKLGLTEYTENSVIDRFSILNRVGFLFQTNLIYLYKIFYPVNLRYYYGYAYYDLGNIDNLYTLLAISAQIIAFLFFIYKFRKNKTLITLAGGYLCFIAYALNFYTPIAGVVADRYVFMALPWICVLSTCLLYKFLHKFKKEVFFNPSILIIILSLIFISHQRVGVWKNNLTLTENDAPYLTNSYEGMRIAAYVYRVESDSSNTSNEKKKYLLKALDCAKNANKVYPNNIFMNIQEAGFYFLLHDYPSAIQPLKRAMEVDSTNKDLNVLLGDVYYQIQDLNLSLKYYTKAFSKDSNDYILINNIGTVLYEKGEKVRCLDFSENLIRQDPSNLAAWENLGYFYLAEGDSTESIKMFKKARDLGMSSNMIPIPLD